MTSNAIADEADDDPGRKSALVLSYTFPPSENWDDDFEFQGGARNGHQDATNMPRQVEHPHAQEESWDDAYEDDDAHASPVKRAPQVDDDDVEDWDSSDNETHDEPKHNTHGHVRGFGVGEFEEEDKTVTARSTTSSRARDPPPPLPIPIFPSHPPLSFPFHTQAAIPSTSPTLSTFSIPVSSTTRDRASIYSQDPLMPASNSSAPHLSSMRAYPHAAGSTPPRKGRRLRKKSRPPEADIFELEDCDPAPIVIPEPEPTTPPPSHRPSTPSPTRQPTAGTPSRASQPSAPPTPSSSLLTRIGSLKRWARRSMGPDDPVLSGWRKPRSSTGPSEAGTGHGAKTSTGPEDLPYTEESLELDIRVVSPTPMAGKGRRSRGGSASGQKAGWFFRAGGGGAERDEMNASSTLPAPVRTPDPSPSKRGNALGLMRKDKDKEREKEQEGDAETPRRRGKLVPALKTGKFASGPQQPASPTRATSRPSRDGPSKPASGPQATHGPRPMSMQLQPARMTLFPRHGNASVGRSAGAPLSDSGPEPASGVENDRWEERVKVNGAESKGRDHEGGMRTLLNGVRRLSLVGSGQVHKRTKSTGGDGVVEVRKRSTECAGPMIQPVDKTTRLLPPVELDSPSPPSAQYINARRGSLPWADYDPSSAGGSSASAGHPRLAGYNSPPSGHESNSPTRPPPNCNILPAHHQHPQQPTQSFSASATSLLAGSHSPTKPSRSPEQSQALGTVPRSRGLARAPGQPQPQPPTPRQLPPLPQPLSQAPASPAPHSASLGRSASSPSHPGPGLRRNSLGDLKTQTQMGDLKTQLPSLSELKVPLGELKIPARISRAQQGLRRDMGMVREFAGCVEHLKHLQTTYTTLLSDLHTAYDASPVSPASRSTSPAPIPAQVQFHLPSRPPSQGGIARKLPMTANSNASMQSLNQATSLNSPTKLHPASRSSQDVRRQLARLEHEYGIWWECAELLVELGGGSGAGTASNPNLAAHATLTLNTPVAGPFKELAAGGEPPSVLRHMTSMSEPGSIFEQALPAAATSKGPPQASPPHPSQWRASTGRHDLSARQLRLLKDMLNTPDPASLPYAAGPYGHGPGYPHLHPYPYSVAEPEGGQPWAAWNPSALTLPSEESSTDPHGPGAASVVKGEGKQKKRRVNRLGMLGLREILRGLKRNAVAEGRLGGGGGYAHGQQASESSASNSTEDDHYNRRRSPWHQHEEHHVARQSTGPEAVAAILDPPPTRNVTPKSPRRPSLASIFRIGKQTSKNVNGRYKEASSSGKGNSTADDEQDTGAGAGGTMGEYSDWERMSRSDLDLTTVAVGSRMATVRGKKMQPHGSSSSPNLPDIHTNSNPSTSTSKRTPATSQTSLWDSSPNSGTPPQASRLPLSIAEEDGALQGQKFKTPIPPKLDRAPSWSQGHPAPRPLSRNGKAAMTGTVRSAPPTDPYSTPDPKVALTPENIKPLLEYARVVSTRLAECIGEVQALLSANT